MNNIIKSKFKTFEVGEVVYYINNDLDVIKTKVIKGTLPRSDYYVRLELDRVHHNQEGIFKTEEEAKEVASKVKQGYIVERLKYE